MKGSILIGKEVTITSKTSWAHGEWGIVKDFDGDAYYIAIWNGNEELVFSRNEFKVRKGQ